MCEFLMNAVQSICEIFFSTCSSFIHLGEYKIFFSSMLAAV